MPWDNKWDDKPTVITQETRPYSEILREHNQAAEASMKDKPHAEFAIAIDWGKDDQTAVVIKQGDKILCMSESVELNIPSGWNTFKANAIQIGDLAVVIITNDPEDHCLVHVPTQTWFDNAVPDGEWKVEQLCLWAWKVQQDKDDLWVDFRAYTNMNYKTISLYNLNVLREYCLLVKVE